MRLISVVLPVYNEAGSIAVCLRGLWQALAGTDHEILVCYDTEEDTTLPAIAAMPDRPASVRLVRNTLGRGALNAIKTGFSAARGDVVVTSMADLSDPPEVILAMADAIRGGADVVSGSRYMRGGSQRGGPWLKRTLSRIAGVSLRWIAGVGTHDATSNFRAYSKTFLDSVTVESGGGFEIALELTVKAHLAGRRVSEVPSSWVDRSSGTSNFRMWRWMPSYLRWYARALAEPAVVWIAAIAGFLLASGRPPFSEPPAIVHRSTLVFLAAMVAAAVLVARRARGRTRLVDALHVGIWLHPWQPQIFASAVASAVLLAIASGRAGTIDALRRAARFLRPKVLLLALLVVLIWITHVTLPIEVPSKNLDVSWSAALSCAAVANLRAGIDYIFTYGPLGVVSTHAYHPEMFGFRIACEGVFRLGLVLVLTRVGLRLGSTLDRILFFGLLLLPSSNDAFHYLGAFAVSAWLLDRKRSSALATLLGLAILATFSLSKFSYVPTAILSVLVLVAFTSRGVSWAAGAAVGGAFCLLVALLWWIAGQALFDLPTWLYRSVQVANGYNGGEATTAPPGTILPAVVLFGLFAFQSGRILLVGSRSPARTAAALIALPILWVAFKAAFVRGADHTTIFFGFTLLAAFVFAIGGAGDRIGTAWRVACVVVSLIGIGAGGPDDTTWADRLAIAVRSFRAHAAGLFNPAGMRAGCEMRLEQARKENELPRTRAVVGDRSIDMVCDRQGVLFLNDFRWTPRPVLQSYITFTPALMELDARFFESERASEFILFYPESIDVHLPTTDDALALQVIARDYVPVLAEKGYLLLERAPRDASPEAPVVEIDRQISFGEDVDLSSLEGRCHVVKLGIEPTLVGRVLAFLYKPPEIHARIDLDSGETRTVRIAPDMVRSGVLVDPYLETQADWMRWYTGLQPARPVRLRIERPKLQSMYSDRIRVEILRTDGSAPRAKPELAMEAMFSWFKTVPSDARASAPVIPSVLRGREVLRVRAPSELRFAVGAGRHTLSGRFGIVPGDWRPGGADFSAVLQSPGREDVVVFHVHVDPTRRELDQRLKYLKASFEAPGPATLLLRTDPGSGNEPPSFETVWSEIEISDGG
ncbi:MAG TPA: glycosyltransferase [Planctomycetota bacterium]|jgi:hypothetical protein|nr:glycosyltransferase [Planctomycetota bacterium]